MPINEENSNLKPGAKKRSSTGSKNRKNLFERNLGFTQALYTLITLLALIATFKFSIQSLNKTREIIELTRSQLTIADSQNGVNYRQFEFTKTEQFKSDSISTLRERWNEQRILHEDSIKDKELLALQTQLNTQLRSYKSVLQSAQPIIELNNFEQDSIASDSVEIHLTFFNHGGRICVFNTIFFDIYNPALSFEANFTNRCQRFELVPGNRYIMSNVKVPKNVALDSRTNFYYEIDDFDPLSSDSGDPYAYFKAPRTTQNGFTTDQLSNNELNDFILALRHRHPTHIHNNRNYKSD